MHDVIYLEGQRDGVEIEIALQWNEGYAENIYAFANNINTIEGGTHLIGFKSALTRTINATPAPTDLLKKDAAKRCRATTCREGLTAVIASRCPSRSSRGRPRPSSATAR